MEQKLKGKKILITGASSGFGKAVAYRAAKDGAKVILAARRLDKLNEVASEVKSLGGEPVIIQTDVTDESQVRNLFMKAVEDGTPLDVVFNNAGLGHVARIYELTTDQIKQMIDVNVYGMIIVAKFATEVFTRQKSGHLINVSSLAGLLTVPSWSVYCATKWAITGFTDSIRYELKPMGIKVTSLHPGVVKTEFFDKEKADLDITQLGEAIDVEVVADQVYDAIFTDKEKIILPDQAKTYSAIYRYFPGLVQSMIQKQADKVQLHGQIPEDEPGFDRVA